MQLGIKVHGLDDQRVSLEIVQDTGGSQRAFDTMKADIEKQKCQAKLGNNKTVDMYTYLLERSKIISFYTKQWMDKIRSQVRVSDPDIQYESESLDEYTQVIFMWQSHYCI